MKSKADNFFNLFICRGGIVFFRNFQGPKLQDFQASCENGRTDLRLVEQIYNDIN
jgi:hypothetical protein